MFVIKGLAVVVMRFALLFGFASLLKFRPNIGTKYDGFDKRESTTGVADGALTIGRQNISCNVPFINDGFTWPKRCSPKPSIDLAHPALRSLNETKI